MADCFIGEWSIAYIELTLNNKSPKSRKNATNH